jgi:hypothetical protein
VNVLAKPIIYAAIVIILIIVGASVGVYVMTNTGDNSPNGGNGGGDETASKVSEAVRLRFTVDNGTQITFMGKNIGTAGNLILRIEETRGSDVWVSILNQGSQQAGTNATGTFVPYTPPEADAWGDVWTAYVDYMQDWKPGDGNVNYAQDGVTATISDIQLNPTLPDDLFVIISA